MTGNTPELDVGHQRPMDGPAETPVGEGEVREAVQIGWVRWDGDEHHDFRYHAPGDPGAIDGFVPVYVFVDA